MQNFEINDNSGIWTAELYVEVFDHFGLDDNDLLSWQNAIPNWAGYGFVSWLLQHQRGKKPFRTQMKFLSSITGSI